VKEFSIDTENFSAIVFEDGGEMYVSIGDNEFDDLADAISFPLSQLGEFVQLLSDVEDELSEPDA
jgi:hypothetical protein